MKKVLIISYYWPPAGGSGVQRWLKFAKYLPHYNWQPIVYTPKNPYFEVKDEALLENISSDLIVWKSKIWEPYSLKEKIFGKASESQSAGVVSAKKSIKNRFFNWIRGNLFIPDPKIYWVKPSVSFLQEKIRKDCIEHIITTGPPHSMHLIGLSLKNMMPNLKWIADFRDPWSQLDLLNEFHLSNYSRRKHAQLERLVLQKNDLTLTVSPSWAIEFQKLGSKRVEMITNGYDPDDFNCEEQKNDRFIIGHYGLLNHLRNPVNLWRSLDNLCEKNSGFSSKLEIHISGNIDEEVLSQMQSFPNLRTKIKELGYLTHKQVLQKYNETDLLLLLSFNSDSGIGNYPGKLFEYFAAKKPVLAFGPEGSDTHKLIQETNTGFYFSYGQANIEKKILEVYSGEYIYEPEKTDRFSRKNLTYQLSDLLSNL